MALGDPIQVRLSPEKQALLEDEAEGRIPAHWRPLLVTAASVLEFALKQT